MIDENSVKLALFDSSTSAEPGGPYAADVYHFVDGRVVDERSRSVLLCDHSVTGPFPEGHFAGIESRIGPAVALYHADPEREGAYVVAECDVAEILTLREVRDRILGSGAE